MSIAVNPSVSQYSSIYIYMYVHAMTTRVIVEGNGKLVVAVRINSANIGGV